MSRNPFAAAALAAAQLCAPTNALSAAPDTPNAEQPSDKADTHWQRVKIPSLQVLLIGGIQFDIGMTTEAELQTFRDITPLESVGLGLLSIPAALYSPFSIFGVEYAFVGPPMITSYKVVQTPLEG